MIKYRCDINDVYQNRYSKINVVTKYNTSLRSIVVKIKFWHSFVTCAKKWSCCFDIKAQIKRELYPTISTVGNMWHVLHVDSNK